MRSRLVKESSASNKNASLLASLVAPSLRSGPPSGAMGTVMKAVNRAYDRSETRPFRKLRLLAILLVVVTGPVLAGLFIFIVFEGRSARQSRTRRASVAPSPCSGASFAGRLLLRRCCSSSRSSTTAPGTQHFTGTRGPHPAPRRRSRLARPLGLFAPTPASRGPTTRRTAARRRDRPPALAVLLRDGAPVRREPNSNSTPGRHSRRRWGERGPREAGQAPV